MAEESPGPKARHYIAVGCLMTIAGAFSGGMMGVLVAKAVGMARRCIPTEGLPACNWYLFAGIGMLLGAISLPTLVLLRMRGMLGDDGNGQRG